MGVTKAAKRWRCIQAERLSCALAKMWTENRGALIAAVKVKTEHPEAVIMYDARKAVAAVGELIHNAIRPIGTKLAR